MICATVCSSCTRTSSSSPRTRHTAAPGWNASPEPDHTSRPHEEDGERDQSQLESRPAVHQGVPGVAGRVPVPVGEVGGDILERLDDERSQRDVDEDAEGRCHLGGGAFASEPRELEAMQDLPREDW